MLKDIKVTLIFFFLSPFLAISQSPITIGGGNNFTKVTITTSGNQTGETGSNTINGYGMAPNLVSASRFLGQATLGTDYETIEDLANNSSFSDWIDEQQTLPISFKLKDHVDELEQMAIDSMNFYGTDISGFELGYRHFAAAWTKYMVESPDLLRMRVAFALSEIFVVSAQPDFTDKPTMLADYYDLLLTHAFGNYRALLEAITYHPAMGQYLTYLNNNKTDADNNKFPDENYAREIMQLFSIGLNQLNQDGTPILNGDGNPIATYADAEITGLAKVFTGLTWSDAPFYGIPNPISANSETTPMIMMDEEHESGVKNLFNGLTIPDRNPVDGDADIRDALDHLFNHQNVAPFMAFRLIQRLVKSNPSPDYIERVSAVFNNNGTGVRGDLGAVIKAILLDEEARDCGAIDDVFAGMLKEPVVRHTQLIRSFNAYLPNGSGIYRNWMRGMFQAVEQRPMYSPTVFNFFTPNFRPIGPINDNDLVAPEFQILDSRTALEYGSLLNVWLREGDDLMSFVALFTGEKNYASKAAYLDLSDELALTSDKNVPTLIERLNLILCHGQLGTSTRSNILKTILQVPEDQPQMRVRLAIWIMMFAPDYLIIK